MGLVAIAGVILWTVVLAPVALGDIGFIPAGIATGSTGAKMMSIAALANEKGVAGKSLVDVLQSAGIADLSGTAAEVLASVANGGGVAAKSLVDVLQSAGMAGLSWTTTETLASVTNKGGLVDVLQSAVGLVALSPVALGAIGFTSAGIAAGSYAAGMMSSAAVANGGGVAAGSLVAVLQSAGHVYSVCEPHQTLYECAADMFAKHKVTAVAIAAGAGGAVILVPVALGAIGFTSTGIAAGSIAAKMMSAAAIANGGGVAAGSLVAVLQSAGAAGLSGTATAAVAGAGGVMGYFATLIFDEAGSHEGIIHKKQCV